MDESNGSFSTLDKALKAAKTYSNKEEAAAGVFQVAAGAFQIGSASCIPGNSLYALLLDASMAAKVIFDDPTLIAIVSNNTIARG